VIIFIGDGKIMRMFAIGLAALTTMSAGAHAAEPKSHHVQKIAKDIYLFEPTEAHINSNTLVIVNQDDVLIVDSHNDPRSAKQLVADIKTVTSKPIRYVINTHFHFDHVGGNEVFGDAEIIGSVFTHHQLSHDSLKGRTAQTILGPNGLIQQWTDGLKKSIAAESDPTKKAKWQKSLAEITASNRSVAEEVETPPTIAVKDKLTLYRAGREIQVIFPGRAHTAGDLLIFLPKEGIVATGDFFENLKTCCGFWGDAYPAEYVQSLQVLKELDFETVVAGHGPTISGDAAKLKITAYQMYLLDLYEQVASFKRQGLSALEASRKLDMSKHKVSFPDTPGPAEFRGEKPDEAVVRIYELLDGKDYHAAAPY
jgi:cyclase